MIFVHTWEKVVSLEKTQTSRLIQGRTGMSAHAEGMDITYHAIGRFTVGKRETVMPARGVRGVRKVADFEVARLRHMDVREFTAADVRAEGFKSDLEFFETWCQMHDSFQWEHWRDGVSWTQATVGLFRAKLAERPCRLYDAAVIEWLPSSVVVYPEHVAAARGLLAKETT